MNVETVWDSVKTTLTKHYMDFDGRATRQEFWYFAAVCCAVSGILCGLGYLTGIALLFVVQHIVNILTTMPYLAVSIRRMHDIGKSGWWLLTIFIPVLGLFVVMYLLAKPSMQGSNQYDVQA